jgi:hypothetical protein
MGIGYRLPASWFLICVLVIGAILVGIVPFSYWTTPSSHRIASRRRRVTSGQWLVA